MAGKVQINETSGSHNITILLEGDEGSAIIGGDTENGTLILRDAHNNELSIIDDHGVHIKDAAGNTLFHLDSNNAAINVGGNDNDGNVVLRDNAVNDRIHLSASDGDIRIKNAAGDTLFHFDSSYAALYVGGKGNEGDVVLRDGSENQRKRIKLSASDAKVVLRDESSVDRISLSPSGGLAVMDENGLVTFRVRPIAGASLLELGEKDRTGIVSMINSLGQPRISLNASTGLLIYDNSGKQVFEMRSSNAAFYVGGMGNAGDIVLRDASEKKRIGLHSASGRVVLKDQSGTETIRLDGETGIVTKNGDCAEEFDIKDPDTAIPGSVMVIDDEERLTLSSKAYDRRVAGVISGAGHYRPAIVLDRQDSDAHRPAVALMGKVFCKVDASHGPIEVGDLLVSSPSPGHAMVAQDSARWPGAVLGKALRGWTDSRGMIPCLVSLQ